MNQNHLKSFTKHDEALLETMTNMLASHPDASIIEASYNIIKVKGDNLKEFISILIDQIPVLDMKMYKIKRKEGKQTKYTKIFHKQDVHCVYFTFYNLRK